MATLEQIQERHEALEKAAEKNPDSVRVGQATSLVKQAQSAGSEIEDEASRLALQAIATQWASFVTERTGEQVDDQLAAYEVPLLEQTPPLAEAPPPPASTLTPYPDARSNRSAPPEWMVRGIMVVVILGLAIGGYIVLGNIFAADETDQAETPTPTFEATTAAILETAPTSVVSTATPTVVVVEVVVAEEETAVAEEISPPTAAPQRLYTVSFNDTLSTIATRFGVTVDEIIASNDLETPDRLEIGQELVIPFPGQAIVPTLLPTPTLAATIAPPTPTVPAVPPEVVIRASDPTTVVPLFIAPDAASNIVATLSQGTFGLALGRSEDEGWYLIELNGGLVRGWVTVQDAALLSPAVPEQLPLLRVVNQD